MKKGKGSTLVNISHMGHAGALTHIDYKPFHLPNVNLLGFNCFCPAMENGQCLLTTRWPDPKEKAGGLGLVSIRVSVCGKQPSIK